MELLTSLGMETVLMHLKDLVPHHRHLLPKASEEKIILEIIPMVCMEMAGTRMITC